MSFVQQITDALLLPLRALVSAPTRLGGAARKLASISLPALISILTAVFMVLAVVAFYFSHEASLQHTDASWSTTDWFLVVVLIFVVPVVLYYVLRLWLEGEVSRYPDIDYAWKAGLAELQMHGVDLQYTPLFLMLGSPGELLEKSVFHAAQLPFRVKEVPTGAAALHWFAEPNGVYLVCTDVGCLSKLAVVAKRAAEQSKATGKSVGPARPAGDVRGTMVFDAGETTAPGPSTVATQIFPDASAPQSTPNIRGTMMISGQEDPIAPPVERTAVLLSQEAQREQELRLEYLCRLIAKVRQPLAPLNGVLAMLPYSIVQTGRREGTELQRIVKRDLGTLVRSLKLRCPVVSMIVGMEDESGFREMVRRVGREAAIAQRFGKGFSVGNPPIPEQLEAVAAHACGLFEAKIYELFREKGSLSKPGNTKLYALLCKIRRTVRMPLTNILVNGFAQDPDERKESEPESLLFSGVYFAATGEADDRQAFVKAVFDKLPAEQEELEWTDVALAEEDRYRSWSQRIMMLDALLALSLAVMIVYLLTR